MIDIAVVGAGRIGRIHAANAVANHRLRLKYVIDPVAAAAEALAAGTGAEVVNIDDVLADSGVRGIVIASSTDTHLEYSVRALEAGKAVFCEKPLDLDLERARAAAPVLGRAGAPFLLGFNRRFDPNFRRLKQLVESGEHGSLETLHIISHDPAPPPINYVRVSGGIFRDMTIHDFDMARWLLGEEPVEIFAMSACLVDPEIGRAGDADTAKLILRTASGRICVISNSRRSGYGYDQRIEAFCSQGAVRAGNVTATTVETWGEAGANGDPLQNFFLDRYADAYRHEMDHFADIIEGRAVSESGYDDGVAALILADAAVRSIQSGAPIAVSEPRRNLIA